MSALRDAIERYVALRRGLGAHLRQPAIHLRHFADFLDQHSAPVITTELALTWATAAEHATPATWAQRLGDVRRFAAWMSATDPRTEVPPRGLLSERYRRTRPYIYSDHEIEHIVRQAARLPSPSGLRALTYATLFGLLASTGLRLSEALALDREDVDLAGGLLAVRRGKFGKARFVPIHESTTRALRRYARKRDSLLASPSSPAFLLAEGGTRVTQDSARYNFVVVSRAIGLRAPATGHHHGRGPRLHDMRHRLAVRTLVRWYREGRDVERELPKLSTYLGHTHVADTYWYIEAIPELLRLATERAMGSREDAP
jgi:integrase